MTDLRTLYTACQTYQQVYQTYPKDIKALAEDKPPFISQELGEARGPISGYYYYYSLIDKDSFEIFAASEPSHKKFYINESGIIRLESKFGQKVE